MDDNSTTVSQEIDWFTEIVHRVRKTRAALADLGLQLEVDAHYHVDTVPIESSPIFVALQELSEQLAANYRQIKLDVREESRVSWVGTAHEIRELLLGILRTLAPDADVITQSWYKPEPNTSGPTHRQRVKYIMQKNRAGSNEAVVAEHADIVEDRVGALVRATYGRASDAAHRSKDYGEVLRILRYFDAFAHDLLNLD